MKRRNFLLATARTGLGAGVGVTLAAPWRMARAAGMELQLPGGGLALVSFENSAENREIDLVKRWITQSAEAVSTFYGRFPVKTVRIDVSFTQGRGRAGGTAFPYDPPLLDLRVPKGAGEKALLTDDWVLVHEMTHLAFPYFRRRRHNWITEGLAVYVEPVARIMAGQMPAETMWFDFVKMMPRGLPAPGDGGYDVTRNWARTYWGGAMFCLICDLRIREATRNKKGLRDALVAINHRLDFTRTSDLGSVLEIGDGATGTDVLTQTWKEMRDTAVSPDLDAMWRALGVEIAGRQVRFREDAPLAGIRRSITTA